MADGKMRSDTSDFEAWRAGTELIKKGRGTITRGRAILQEHGLTGIPSPLWRNKHIPATKCSSSSDKLHQRNLGFVSRIEKALIKPNGLFGGAVAKHSLNAFFSVLRLHGFPGLCKSSKLLETSSLQAKERQVRSYNCLLGCNCL